MRSPTLLLATGALAIMGLGCSESNSGGPPSPLQGNLDAAAAISDSYQRDGALIKVAEEAGAAGDFEVARKAIRKINDSYRKDGAAATTALKFAAQGKTAEATEIAKLINETYKRDQTLAAIAKTSPPAPK